MHASILAYMFTLVEQNRITVSLDSANPAAPSTNNVTYVQGFVANLLKAAFPHLSENQIKITVQGMVNLNQDIPAFKEHLRDFLVQIRVSWIYLCVFPHVSEMNVHRKNFTTFNKILT